MTITLKKKMKINQQLGFMTTQTIIHTLQPTITPPGTIQVHMIQTICTTTSGLTMTTINPHINLIITNIMTTCMLCTPYITTMINMDSILITNR